jgi:hypothetical protein
MPLKQRVSEWDGRKWYTVTAVYYADPLDIVPDGKGGYWFGAQAILNGSTWTTEEVPGSPAATAVCPGCRAPRPSC